MIGAKRKEKGATRPTNSFGAKLNHHHDHPLTTNLLIIELQHSPPFTSYVVP